MSTLIEYMSTLTKLSTDPTSSGILRGMKSSRPDATDTGANRKIECLTPTDGNAPWEINFHILATGHLVESSEIKAVRQSARPFYEQGLL